MSATGIFAEAQTTLAASLTALGLAVVTDSRNARPMSIMDSEISVISGTPSMTAIGGQDIPSFDLTIRVSTMRS